MATRYSKILGKVLNRSIRTESTNTTLLAADANQMLRFTGTDLQVLTIPDVLSVGESVQIVQDNTGQIEFSSGSGVTLLSDSGEFGSNGQNTKVDLVCVAAGEYRLYGELVEAFAPVMQALVVAGGGSGGASNDHGGSGAGGGGGGGLINHTGKRFGLGSSYTVTIGAGGATFSGHDTGNAGSNSVFDNLTALGGGAGGGGEDKVGTNGGSGGGNRENSSAPGQGLQPSQSGESGEFGFGNDGGVCDNTDFASGGGGAGASPVSTSSANNNTPGGAGLDVSSTFGTASGESGVFAGGGGATNRNGTSQNGGVGGGGNAPAGAGSANTGGGGGAGNHSASGGAGGSGIVILRYPSDFTITIGAGLTGTTSTVGANKVTEITAGTGNVSWS